VVKALVTHSESLLFESTSVQDFSKAPYVYPLASSKRGTWLSSELGKLKSGGATPQLHRSQKIEIDLQYQYNFNWVMFHNHENQPKRYVIEASIDSEFKT